MKNINRNNFRRCLVTRKEDFDPDDIITVINNLATDLHNILDYSEILIKKINDNAISLTQVDSGCINFIF